MMTYFYKKGDYPFWHGWEKNILREIFCRKRLPFAEWYWQEGDDVLNCNEIIISTIIGLATGVISGLLVGWKLTEYYRGKDRSREINRLLFKLHIHMETIEFLFKEKGYNAIDLTFQLDNDFNQALSDLSILKTEGKARDVFLDINLFKSDMQSYFREHKENEVEKVRMDEFFKRAYQINIDLMKARENYK